MKWLVLVLLFLPTLALAYELNGTLRSNNDGDNTYFVYVQNNEGHHYTGNAVEQSNGTLLVSIEDDKGETFTGTATINETEDYDLDLVNPATGIHVHGELEAE